MPLSSEKARANALIGGGRPKGTLSAETRLKMKMAKVFNSRVYKMTAKLLNAQAVTALGTHKMIVMEKDEEGVMHVETIRDEKRMEKLLDEGVYGKDYLILEGSKADWKAANALLDRAYGKAKESIELNAHHTFSLKGLAQDRGTIPAENVIELPPEK